MVTSPRKKRNTKAQKSPLMLFLLIVILLAILSVVVAYFILQDDDRKEVIPVQTTTETQAEEEEPTIAVEPMYTGTWVSNYDGTILTLSRSSFTLEMPSVDQKTAIEGELSVMKNVLTFVYTSGAEICRGEEGHYQYMLEDNGDIFFKLIKDNCKTRSDRMEVSWFRL